MGIHGKNELLCRNILSGVCHIGYASSATLMSYQVLAYVCPVSQLKRMKYYLRKFILETILICLKVHITSLKESWTLIIRQCIASNLRMLSYDVTSNPVLYSTNVLQPIRMSVRSYIIQSKRMNLYE